MIKRFFSLIWILHSVQDGLSQYVMCPYENGLYYTTSPECLVYYRCEDRMLWTGVCFPWQRFDVHSMSCRYAKNVDCNPEYAGIWRRLYREIDQIDQELQETNKVIAGVTEDENAILGNNIKEAPEKTINNNCERGGSQEISNGTVLNNSKAEGEDITNEVSQEDELKGDEATTNKESCLNNNNKVNKNESLEEPTIQETKTNMTQDDNNDIFNDVEDNKGEIGNENGKIEQGERTKNDEKREENRNPNTIEDQLEDNKSKRDVNNDGKSQKLSENTLIARESIIPDLTSPIVTSVYNEESTTETEGMTDECDEATNCQSSTTDEMEPFFIESTTSVAGGNQEDSSGGFWYWCGSGRFVMTQTAEDPNTICQQLEDPEFIDQEGPGTGTQDWGGHTFLGSGTSVSKRHT